MDLPPPPNHSPCPPISTSFFHSLEESLCGKTPPHTQKLADPIPNPPKSEKVPSIPTNSSQSCTSNLSPIFNAINPRLSTKAPPTCTGSRPESAPLPTKLIRGHALHRLAPLHIYTLHLPLRAFVQPGQPEQVGPAPS